MFRRVLQIFLLIALAGAAALLSGAASASAAQLVSNGGFETGTLEGWSQYETASAWQVLGAKGAEEAGIKFHPVDGAYSAYAQPSDEGTSIIYQDVALPPATSDQLTADFGYWSEAEFVEPGRLVRIDVMNPSAPLTSVAPSDILATVFATHAGSPRELAPAPFGADLSPFAGQTVRLRLMVTDAEELNAVIDDVSIDSNPLPAPLPQPSPTTPMPPNAFSVGRLTLDRKHGGAKLNVTLPGAGRLTVADARREIAIGSARVESVRQLPTLIRTASVQTSGPQTVRVFLRPTPIAKRVLSQGGKLRFRLQLSFTPDGGMAASQAYAGTLRKVLRPARR